jgi:hypothetical protein
MFIDETYQQKHFRGCETQRFKTAEKGPDRFSEL